MIVRAVKIGQYLQVTGLLYYFIFEINDSIIDIKK